LTIPRTPAARAGGRAISQDQCGLLMPRPPRQTGTATARVPPGAQNRRACGHDPGIGGSAAACIQNGSPMGGAGTGYAPMGGGGTGYALIGAGGTGYATGYVPMGAGGIWYAPTGGTRYAPTGAGGTGYALIGAGGTGYALTGAGGIE